MFYEKGQIVSMILIYTWAWVTNFCSFQWVAENFCWRVGGFYWLKFGEGKTLLSNRTEQRLISSLIFFTEFIWNHFDFLKNFNISWNYWPKLFFNKKNIWMPVRRLVEIKWAALWKKLASWFRLLLFLLLSCM